MHRKENILQVKPFLLFQLVFRQHRNSFFFDYAQDREMTTLSRDREMSTLSREQSSVPNFASLMAKEELEDASCYYPASGRRSLINVDSRI
jgi:hypothetical protein